MKLIHPSQVHLTGNHYVDSAEVLEIFARDRGESVLRIPLEERRHQIEQLPWVAHATVRRALPNTLQVQIVERTPIAFLREPSGLSLIDINGVILQKPLRDNFHFPVVKGIGTDTPLDDRGDRMHLFAGFMQSVESARPGASNQVSEVNLSDNHDLVATLTGVQPDFVNGAIPMALSAAPLVVHFGDGNFEAKYQTLIQKIGEVRAKVGALESVDLRFDGELIANPEVVAAPPQPAARARVARRQH